MRLLPVGAGGTAIEFPHDIELQGHTIPAGTIIWVHLFVAHNSGLYWDEPERFDPERFLEPGAEYWQPAGQPAGAAPPAGPERGPSQDGQDDVKEAPAGPRSSGTQPLRFFPFSLGTRDCVGQSLARLNYTATLATLWGQFSFRLAAEVSLTCDEPFWCACFSALEAATPPVAFLAALAVCGARRHNA